MFFLSMKWSSSLPSSAVCTSLWPLVHVSQNSAVISVSDSASSSLSSVPSLLSYNLLGWQNLEFMKYKSSTIFWLSGMRGSYPKVVNPLIPCITAALWIIWPTLLASTNTSICRLSIQAICHSVWDSCHCLLIVAASGTEKLKLLQRRNYRTLLNFFLSGFLWFLMNVTHCLPMTLSYKFRWRWKSMSTRTVMESTTKPSYITDADTWFWESSCCSLF